MKQYFRVIKMVFQERFQYRFDLISSWFIQAISLIVPFALWGAIFKEKSGLVGYNFSSMMTYMIAITFFGRVLLANGIENEIAQEIREGKISRFVTRPVSYRLYMLAVTFGRKMIEFSSLLVPFLGLVFLLSRLNLYTLSPLYPNAVFFMVSGGLAMILSYLIYFSLGLIAFWMIESSALYVTLGTGLYFLAGGLFPLDLFPNLKGVFQILPFQYQLFFPLKVYLGGFTLNQIWQGFVFQIGWIIIFCFVSHKIWSWGLKHYSAVGG